MGKANTIPTRAEVAKKDMWDLSTLFPDEASWEGDFLRFGEEAKRIASFRGRLGDSASALREALCFFRDLWMLAERLDDYASRRLDGDLGSPSSKERSDRLTMLVVAARAESSYLDPEILSIPEASVSAWLEKSEFAEFRVFINRILRDKPYLLKAGEERLMAMQGEVAQLPGNAFHALSDVDLDFGALDTKDGPRPLSNSSFAFFIRDPDRELRKRAYLQYYSAFDAHKNLLAEIYAGSVRQDKYYAAARGFSSARARALFPDDVPESVYDNLVLAVRARLPDLHEYYRLRARSLGLTELRHYDAYASLVPETQTKIPYDEAVRVVIEALAPLGEEYCAALKAGLLGGWVDRYENKGKRSGAYSAGSYSSNPFILMNYKEDVLDDLFTLAHEGGHSMHSRYSAASNPFMQYSYTIFEAEVASTFNEQLLYRHLSREARDPAMRLRLVNKEIDAFVATLFRQTMFAEFEWRAHEMEESGKPLTLDAMRGLYRGLLTDYFGPILALEEQSDLECLRIPHFYRAFYVYKYATGMSAAVSLARGLSEGGKPERDAYFDFLKSGGSQFPLKSLARAGVDMASPEPVDRALDRFAQLVRELKDLLGGLS